MKSFLSKFLLYQSNMFTHEFTCGECGEPFKKLVRGKDTKLYMKCLNCGERQLLTPYLKAMVEKYYLINLTE